MLMCAAGAEMRNAIPLAASVYGVDGLKSPHLLHPDSVPVQIQSSAGVRSPIINQNFPPSASDFSSDLQQHPHQSAMLPQDVSASLLSVLSRLRRLIGYPCQLSSSKSGVCCI